MKRRFGPQNWWPGETSFEVMVGAVLTQNTNWQNVMRAIENLKKHDLLSPEKLHSCDETLLASLIRSSGYYNQKARKLKFLCEWLSGYGYDIERIKQVSMDKLRAELLEIKGIGPETCDDILLYALDKPTFVVDSYTFRILNRHSLIEEGATYDEIKEYFESRLKKSLKIYNEFHALIVATGKNYCRKEPQCDECPLKKYLP